MTMANKRELGMGNVQVTLVDGNGNSQNVVLKPSLHAVRTLSRKYGGLQQVVERILKVDFDVMVDVFEVGMQLPMGNPKARSELEQSLYASGLLDIDGGLVTIASNYITMLIHGGRPPPPLDGVEVPQTNPPSAS
jgi:hypothetical protein